jgi:hypothetical protein
VIVNGLNTSKSIILSPKDKEISIKSIYEVNIWKDQYQTLQNTCKRITPSNNLIANSKLRGGTQRRKGKKHRSPSPIPLEPVNEKPKLNGQAEFNRTNESLALDIVKKVSGTPELHHLS